jgi:hypothetical protein
MAAATGIGVRLLLVLVSRQYQSVLVLVWTIAVEVGRRWRWARVKSELDLHMKESFGRIRKASTAASSVRTSRSDDMFTNGHFHAGPYRFQMIVTAMFHALAILRG